MPHAAPAKDPRVRLLPLTHRPTYSSPVNADVHFQAELANVSSIYDLPRLHAATGIVSLDLAQFKRRQHPANQLDALECWSFMEIKAGTINDHQVEAGWNEFAVFTNFWAVPKFNRTADGTATRMDQALAFLQDEDAQDAWLDKVQLELLPQVPAHSGDLEKSRNVKSGFDPVTGTRPTSADAARVLCLDSAFWLGDNAPPPPHPQGLPHDAWREGAAWREVGRHLHFTEEAGRVADGYLATMFGVERVEDVPPYIAVHM